jgi:hypothetical protein
MVQGVRAKTLAFLGFDQTLTLIQQPGWPWVGNGGITSSARRISLNGGPPRGFILRLLWVRLGPRLATRRFQLESGDGLAREGLLAGELTFEPAVSGGAGTRVGLIARPARALASAGISPTTVKARDIAKAYARSLVEAIAMVLENAATSDRRSQTDKRARR